MDVSELKTACSGRWFGILSNLGIEVRTDGRHEPCPYCGGHDRFRMDKNGDGFYCNQCRPGDTIALIQRTLGLTFPETIQRISEVVGGCSKMETEKKIDIAKVKEILNKIWRDSVPLTGSDPASQYLHSRKLVLSPENVRYCPELYESDTKKHYPAMVALVMNSNGKSIALHRTYLDRDKPQKANIESPKKLTPGLEPLSGCAIRLFPPKGGELGIAEGVENAIACRQMFDIPVWSCISSTILQGFIPPEGVRKIIIYGDSDHNYTGQKAAYTLANKLYLKDMLVEVAIPSNLGQDWADVLLDISK